MESWIRPRIVGIVILTAPLFLGSHASAQDAAYVSQKMCKMCHNKESTGDQWKKWQQMKHANAYKTLMTDAAKVAAKKVGLETPPQESPECLRCHVTGYNAEEKTFHPKIDKEDGVQCESCHGPGSQHMEYGKQVMMKKVSPDSDVPKHIVRPDNKTCVKCHNDESPAWNPEKYTLEDGTKVGFDFKQAFAQIAHLDPTKKHEALTGGDSNDTTGK